MTSPETDHRGSEVLSEAECYELLGSDSGGVGRLGFVNRGRVMVLPVSFVLSGPALIFRLGPGEMLRSVLSSNEVTFEADRVEGTRRPPSAWSVVAHGRGQAIGDPQELNEAVATGLTPLTPESGEVYVRLRPSLVSGRRFMVNPLARSRIERPPTGDDLH